MKAPLTYCTKIPAILPTPEHTPIPVPRIDVGNSSDVITESAHHPVTRKEWNAHDDSMTCNCRASASLAPCAANPKHSAALVMLPKSNAFLPTRSTNTVASALPGILANAKYKLCK